MQQSANRPTLMHQGRLLQAERLLQRNERAAAKALLGALVNENAALTKVYIRAAALHQEERDYAAAKEILRRGLAASQGAAEIHAALAECLEDTGETDDAERHYRQALQARPGWAYPVGGLLALLRERAEPELLAAAWTLLDDPTAEAESKALAGYGLGKALEALGDYAAALRAWTAANAARRLAGEYDHRGMVTRVNGLIQHVTADALRPLLEGGDRTHRPIFVIGMPRSGTTLLEQILDRHPGLVGVGETTGIATLSHRMPAIAGSIQDWPEAVGDISSEAAGQAAAAYLALVNPLRGDRVGRSVDKAPLNFFHVGLIAALFPNATVLHCMRDPRDVLLSIYAENFGTNQQQATRWPELVKYYLEYERLMAHWRAVLPGYLHDVQYENLVTDPDNVIRKVIALTEEPWDEACLTPHQSVRAVATPSKWQVRRAINTRSVGRWRRFEPYLSEFLAAPGYADLSAAISRAEQYIF